MRRLDDPLPSLLSRAVRTEAGCLILPNSTAVRPTVKVNRRAVKAARFVYERAHGKTDLYILHHCDNPKCFEETHLYAGDQSQNMIDMYTRGRRGIVDTHPQRKKELKDA